MYLSNFILYGVTTKVSQLSQSLCLLGILCLHFAKRWVVVEIISLRIHFPHWLSYPHWKRDTISKCWCAHVGHWPEEGSLSVRDIGHLCVPIKGMHRQLRVYYALLLFRIYLVKLFSVENNVWSFLNLLKHQVPYQISYVI